MGSSSVVIFRLDEKAQEIESQADISRLSSCNPYCWECAVTGTEAPESSTRSGSLLALRALELAESFAQMLANAAYAVLQNVLTLISAPSPSSEQHILFAPLFALSLFFSSHFILPCSPRFALPLKCYPLICQ